MPTVPFKGPQIAETAPTQRRLSTNVSRESFGAGRASSAGAAKQVSKIIEKESNRMDEINVLDAESKFSNFDNDYLHNKDNGALTRRGKDSFTLAEEQEDAYLKKLEEIEKDLTTKQRSQFRRVIDGRLQSSKNKINQHIFTQTQQHDDEAFKSSMEGEHNYVTANFNDRAATEASIGRQEAKIAKYAARRGLSDEAAASMLSKSVSQSHSSVINQMLLSDNDLAAKEYFKENKKEFVGSDLINAQKALEEGSLRGESQRKTDLIMSKDKSMSDSLEEARKIKDAKLRDATTKRIKSRFSEKKAEQDQLQDQLFQAASATAEKTKSRDSIDPATWSKLTLSQRNAIDARVAQLRKGVEPINDDELYYKFTTEASSPATQSKFLRTNLLEHRHKFDNAHWNRLVNLQASLRKGDTKIADGIRSDKQVVDDTLKSVDIDPNPKKGEDAKQIALFRAEMDRQIEDRKRRTGQKTVSNEEVREIAESLVVSGDVPGTGFFGLFKKQKRIFELEPGEVIDIEVEDIPKKVKRDIEDALIKQRIPVTDEKIKEIYEKKIGETLGR